MCKYSIALVCFSFFGFLCETVFPPHVGLGQIIFDDKKINKKQKIAAGDFLDFLIKY